MRASTGGRIAVTDFVRIMSQNPAKTFGLYPQKGTLRPGSDADMVLVDPGWPRTVPERDPHLAVGSSIFMGRQCLGGPVTVLRRGKSSANAAKSREPFPAASSPRAPS
ncbi:amidohydrolase family protein [Bilophila wadsworthia]